jgi:hypothetical protein
MPPCPETTCVTPAGHPKSHDLGAVTYSVGTPPLLFGQSSKGSRPRIRQYACGSGVSVLIADRETRG